MFYYVQDLGEEVVAWLQSDVPKNRPGFIQVTPEEFLELGGHGLETPPDPPAPPVEADPLEELQKENKMLKAQLQAQVDRSDFIEDCIAEMATVVYGGV